MFVVTKPLGIKHNYIYFSKTANQPFNLTSPFATVNRDKRRLSAESHPVKQLKTQGKVQLCVGQGTFDNIHL